MGLAKQDLLSWAEVTFDRPNFLTSSNLKSYFDFLSRPEPFHSPPDPLKINEENRLFDSRRGVFHQL